MPIKFYITYKNSFIFYRRPCIPNSASQSIPYALCISVCLFLSFSLYVFVLAILDLAYGGAISHECCVQPPEAGGIFLLQALIKFDTKHLKNITIYSFSPRLLKICFSTGGPVLPLAALQSHLCVFVFKSLSVLHYS